MYLYSLILETARWPERQNGKQDAETSKHTAKTAKRKTAETDRTTARQERRPHVYA